MSSEKNLHHFCFWHPISFDFYMVILSPGTNENFLPHRLKKIESSWPALRLKEEMPNILDVLEFWPDWTTDNRVTCPSLDYPKIYLLLSGELHIKNIFLTYWLAGGRLLPFGLLVSYFYKLPYNIDIPIF